MARKPLLYGFLTSVIVLSVALGFTLVHAAPWKAPSAQGGAPTVVSYQGTVMVGTTPYDGTGYFKFAIVDSGGTYYWSNDGTKGEPSQSVELDVSNGFFTVLLGDTSLSGMTQPLDASVFSSTDRYLRVWFSQDGSTFTQMPDVRIASVPYALQAEEAKTAASVPWSGLTGVPAGFADGVDDDTTYTAGTGLTLNDTTFALDTTYTDDRYWKAGGNAYTAEGTLGLTTNYALNIVVSNTRALRLEPGVDGWPNVIGGEASNLVATGVKGATISGGGPSPYVSPSFNAVYNDFGTIGGGSYNTAGQSGSNAGDYPYATVGGGLYNTASGSYSTVGGGDGNTASNFGSTVGGGYYNTASGSYATVSGGSRNTASGPRSTVGGGSNNTASGDYSAVGSGYYNTASGDYSNVSGGWNNTASGVKSTVSGGQLNTASGDYATVPGGLKANASHFGEMAYASGAFAEAGDAQTSLYVLRNTSTGTDWTELFLDPSTQARLTIASGRALFFYIQIVALSDGGEAAGYEIKGLIKNSGGNTTLVGTLWIWSREDDLAWDVNVTADDVNDALSIQVKGNGETIRWVAMVRTTEVEW